MSAAPARPDDDIAALAKGGRTNFLGFVLRLAARIPFLFIAGRFYGADVLGRFAYAVLVIELGAQLATMLKRGLPALSTTDQPHAGIVLGNTAAYRTSAAASAILMAFPQACLNSEVHADWLLPLVIFVLPAPMSRSPLAYRHDASLDRHVRAIVEPW